MRYRLDLSFSDIKHVLMSECARVLQIPLDWRQPLSLGKESCEFHIQGDIVKFTYHISSPDHADKVD